MVQIEKGYRTLSVIELVNIFVTIVCDLKMYDAFRVLCAWLYLDAKDEATRHSLKRRGRFVGAKRYPTRSELREIVGGKASIAKQLEKLEAAGLITVCKAEVRLTQTPLEGTRRFLALICGETAYGHFKRKPTRAVPVPHEWLLSWARPGERSRLTPLLHLFYVAAGLSFKGRKESCVQNAACFKFEQLIGLLALDASRLKRTRAKLIRQGRITPDRTRYQRKLNRDGHHFEVRLCWSRSREAATAVGAQRGAETPPPAAQNCRQMPPPIRDQKQATLVKRNQKRSGVSSKRAFVNAPLPRPSLGKVLVEDLWRVERLAELFRQQRFIPHTQMNFQHFVEAAVRARGLAYDPASGKNHPVRTFLGIVKRQLWHHITHAEEDRARKAIREYVFESPAPSVRAPATVSDQRVLPESLEASRELADTPQCSSGPLETREEIALLIEQSLASVPETFSTRSAASPAQKQSRATSATLSQAA